MEKSLSVRIAELRQPSAREEEICGGKATLASLSPRLKAEYRLLEKNREDERTLLLKQGWEGLQKLGYKKISYSVNAAVASGHSDYDDPSDRYSKRGIETPNGDFIDGGAAWSFAIEEAINHAGL